MKFFYYAMIKYICDFHKNPNTTYQNLQLLKFPLFLCFFSLLVRNFDKHFQYLKYHLTHMYILSTEHNHSNKKATNLYIYSQNTDENNQNQVTLQLINLLFLFQKIIFFHIFAL